MIRVEFKRSLFLYLFSAALVVAYLACLYVIGHVFMKERAEGSLIYDQDGRIRGSYLLTQNYKQNKFFHARLNERFHSKCDVALYNDAFRVALKGKLKAKDGAQDVSMITASSSLLDPYIKRAEALEQATRVATARDMDLADLIEIIDDFTLPTAEPFFVLDIVNVTKLNARLEGMI